VTKLEGHTKCVNVVSFSKENIASGSSDYSIRIWDIKLKKTVMNLEGHTNSVFSLVFSFDEKLLISGSSDNTIRI
jgi:WD40 repeat protein